MTPRSDTDPLDRITFMRVGLGNTIVATMPQEVAEALVAVARAAREHYNEWAAINPPDLLPLPIQKIGEALARLDGAS